MTTPVLSKPQHSIKIRVFDAPSARQGKGRPKIMLLKLGERIGDFVIAIDAFSILRDAFPQAEITLICLPSIVPLAESTGLFDRVAGFSYVHDVMKHGKVPPMDKDDQVAAFAALMDGEYLLAADFRHDGSTRRWLDHVKAACRAGFAVPTDKGLDIALPSMEWDVPWADVEKQGMPVHAETRLTLLAHAIVETLREKPSMSKVFHMADDGEGIAAYRALKNLQRMKIGLSLGAGSELRQWDIDYWAALLPRIARTRAAHFVFFGGEADKAETRLLADKLSVAGCGDTFTDLTGSMPLAHVPAYMGLLDAYIGCDTGLTHMAGNLGIPTVNLFAGISNISVWRTRGTKVKTVYAEVICSPCHLRFKSECPNNNVCMKVISPDIVYACFEQVVGV